MSKKQINRFIKDLQKLADKHDVHIGFLTIDDGDHQVCGVFGINNNDGLLKGHIDSLKTVIMDL